MNTTPPELEEEVRLYADAQSCRFALKRDGERWVQEFSTLAEAIRFVADLPHTSTRRIVLHNENGNRLTQLIVRQ